MKITAISDEKWKEILAFRDEVLEKALRPGPVNVDKLRPVWNEMYAELKRPPPEIITCPSPPACLKMCREKSTDKKADFLGQAFWAATNQGYWAWLKAGLMAGVEVTEQQQHQLEWWLTLGDGCFWWWAFEDCVIACDKPVTFWDERKRLHNENGPAVEFSDGYALYSWHGARINPRIITDPESFTTEEIRGMTNSEEVRALAEKLGWDRFLEKLGTKTIDTWTDTNTGLTYELLEAAKSWGEDQPRWLKMQSPPLFDGTQPYYVEAVHPDLKTAKAARRWQIKQSRDPKAVHYRHGDVAVCFAPAESMYWPTAEEANANPDMVFAEER